MSRIKIPKDFEVQPLKAGQTAKGKATCGECGLSWDDAIITSMTPAPSARCPFEAFHIEDRYKNVKVRCGCKKDQFVCGDHVRMQKPATHTPECCAANNGAFVLAGNCVCYRKTHTPTPYTIKVDDMGPMGKMQSVYGPDGKKVTAYGGENALTNAKIKVHELTNAYNLGQVNAYERDKADIIELAKQLLYILDNHACHSRKYVELHKFALAAIARAEGGRP